LHLKPSLLNGLGQSTLLHFSPARRFIFKGHDLYFSQVPYALVRSSHHLKCPTNDTDVYNTTRRSRIKERFLCEETDKVASGFSLKNVSSSKRTELTAETMW
ncbi:hypothetical protein RYX36_022880, partial [Vicia faba]